MLDHAFLLIIFQYLGNYGSCDYRKLMKSKESTLLYIVKNRAPF